jgi:UDP-N-acetylmuramoyl-tripeptide--D-alanyl-D-alanine ligase
MITLAEATRATGGRWLRQPLPDDTPLAGGAFDTRALGGAEVFFALKGEHADGHAFVDRLAGTTVRLAVVQRDVPSSGFGGALLLVEDTLRALAAMAQFLVGKYQPKVVAITGSYGKTTAKEIIAHVLSGRRRVLKSPGSLNNEIGIPITLLRLDGSQDTCVLEYSARKPGDIAYLSLIAPPDVAVLLGVGHAHIGVFGSREAIYQAKGEIFRHLRPGGLALVNSEDPRLAALAGSRRLLTFGKDAGDFRAVEVSTDRLGRQSFTAVHGEARLALRSGISGAHGCIPMLAAWAVARELGVPDAEVSARAGFQPTHKGRADLLTAPGGAIVLDDTYNASPETVVNLIATLASIEARERILVLGHLSELEAGLGDTAAAIAKHLSPPLTRCYILAAATPELPTLLRQHARGIPVEQFDTLANLIRALRAMDRPGTVIGVKGARSAHMERAVQGLLGTDVACTLHSCGLLKHCTDCDALSRHG